ncbi:MAG: cell division protein ZapA, partial [Oscillospiraceae bacterium]
MPANKIKISVCGSDYVISSTDSEEYVLELAEKLNGEMQAFLKVNESSSVTAAAVLSALGYMDELQKTIN